MWQETGIESEGEALTGHAVNLGTESTVRPPRNAILTKCGKGAFSG